jgi:hypothetical protein
MLRCQSSVNRALWPAPAQQRRWGERAYQVAEIRVDVKAGRELAKKIRIR